MTATLLVIGAIGALEIGCATHLPVPTAEEIQARLSRGQAIDVLNDLRDERSDFSRYVYAGIESGDPDWLNVACQLRPSTDGAASLALTFSVARALPKRPVEALSLIARCFTVAEVCTVPYIEDERHSSAHVRRVEQALSESIPATLTSVAQQCLAEIRKPS